MTTPEPAPAPAPSPQASALATLIGTLMPKQLNTSANWIALATAASAALTEFAPILPPKWADKATAIVALIGLVTASAAHSYTAPCPPTPPPPKS